ncbi:MAG TPA: response regulator transcription factor [Flavobacteriales bacterium]|nr:response regulator transcription factor [Flavobacteriales bacterium]HIA11841.1 response regulator transcription factor [Flavobacteriales bacterium]HIO71745.1 response regulator transcription factor [Flavobacteriales bacterium]
MIEVFVADSSFLCREGIISLIQASKGVVLVGEADCSKTLMSKIGKLQPDILMLNYSSSSFDFEDIGLIMNFLPKTKILAVTHDFTMEDITSAIEAGVTSHVLLECSREEISDAIYATANGEKFFCGKIVDKMMRVDEPGDLTALAAEIACDPIRISSRELDIIKLIAEGNTNKHIANSLFISTHTVMTHRKNIMSKLGISNTAGIVLYAVRENLIDPEKFLFNQGNI